MDLYIHEHNWTKVAETENLLGALNIEKKDTRNAEKYLLKALEIAKDNKLKSLMTKILNNLGMFYQIKGDKEKSLDYYYKSINIKKELYINPTVTYRSIIDIYLEQIFLKEVQQIINELKQYIEDKTDIYHI